MNNNITNTISQAFGKAGLKIQKHSPEILVIGGICGTVVAAVMACKATTKISEINEEAQDQLEKIHSAAEVGEIVTKEEGLIEYTEEIAKKDTTIVYAQTGLKYAKLYAPSVILGVVSITAILAGHNITNKRNVALSAAYYAVDKSFKEYRDRVVSRFGEQLDKELRYNIKTVEVDEIVTDEKGKEKVVKKTIEVTDNPNTISDYARFFDEGCAGWTKDPEYNLNFLKKQCAFANDKLKTEKRLFLNDVYQMLGIPKTKAGYIVGWIYDEENPVGDNYVDFGIYDTNREAVRNFVNGYERTILLDFNVDGNILDLI